MPDNMMLVELLKVGAERIRVQLSREDDWMPVFAFTDRDDLPHLIDGSALMRESRRFEGIHAVARILSEQGASNVAMIQTIWSVANIDMAEMQAILDGRSPRAREHPNRKEMLQIVAVDSTGTTIGKSAEIIRRSDYAHPKLGPWEDIPDGAEVFGAMIDPLKEVIVRAQDDC